MATRINDYAPAITDESRKELKNIAVYFKGKQAKPFLVGGWAVYHYTKDAERPPAILGKMVLGKSRVGDPYGFTPLGSKDIDLVFKNSEEKQSFEHGYCKQNGYKKRADPFNIFNPRLQSKHSNGVEILLDMATLQAYPRETDGARLDWSILPANSAPCEITAGATLPVSIKELLLCYKAAALFDRHKLLQTEPSAYLESKVWKDAFDIIALWDTGIDKKKLAAIAKQTGAKKLLNEAKEIIAINIGNWGIARYNGQEDYLEIVE